MLEVGVNAVGLVLIPLLGLHLSFHRGHPFAFALLMSGLSLVKVPAVTALRVERGHCSPASAFLWAQGELAKASPRSVGSR